MGNAIMTFYAALIDLLGRCAPEMHVSALGPKNSDPGLPIYVKNPQGHLGGSVGQVSDSWF